MFSQGEGERYTRRALWGYPSLIKRFFDDVQPALVKAQEERRAQIERAERRAPMQINTDSHGHNSNDENPDQHATPSTPSFSHLIQSGPSASPEVTPEPPDLTKKDGQQERLVHPDNHSPSDKGVVPTASENREVLRFTTGDPTEQLGVPDERERSDQHNEIEEIQEIQYTSEHTIEGSHIVQNAEE